MRPLVAVAPLAALLAAAAVGCGPPALEDLVVENSPNAYSLQATLNDASGNREEVWSVSGDRVWVDWSGTALGAGSVSLALTSPDGLQAYRESATAAGPPAAAASITSSAGEWTIRLDYSGAEGSLALDLTGVQ
ncbi:MAG: hypothetical protein P1V51_24805 [Deltaproteobacteria bacterium]|nr:hypothetical protein [Deltaproteobacteria bacterium]